MSLSRTLGHLVEPLTGRAWTPNEVSGRIGARAIEYARRGLVPQDRVALHYGNSLEFFVDLLAIWQLGACAIPLDGRYTHFEVVNLLRSARPRFSVWREPPDAALGDALRELGIGTLLAPQAASPPVAATSPQARLRPEDEALILFTSGTTGDPKGVVHTHRSLRARWTSLAASLGIAPYRRTLCLLPTHFGHGLICNCLFPWLHGQDLHVLPPFRADLLMRLGELIDAHGITFLSSVPTVWRLALKTSARPKAGSLARISCGSAPFSGALWAAVQEWAGIHEVINAYGITETGSWLAGTTVPFEAPQDGLVGTAWGGEIRVLRTRETSTAPDAHGVCGAGESGHIWVRTPALMKGYLGRDDLTSAVVAGDWFATGDIGLLDDRGWLHLRGRERDEINRGGAKVYPQDVEGVIERFPGVLDVCSFAQDDPLLGEEVGVAVVLREASDAILVRLHEWTSVHLAPHQVPRRWYLLGEIARSSRGKVRRTDVAAHCERREPVPYARLLKRHA
ncbi:MAG TPA: class I adenylate-forming enzyme family protein [Steroidobacteraceae bacterium]|nr:class I adenylate-forming enzyme family protein [Steroidobacteraceae bacterium]